MFTENSLHSVQFVGAPFTFGAAIISTNVHAGPNAAIAVNDVVFWMGQENFYLYDGRINPYHVVFDSMCLMTSTVTVV